MKSRTLSFQMLFAKFGAISMTLVLLIVFTVASPYFLSWSNVNIMLMNQMFVGFFALAALTTFISGNFDISLTKMMTCICIIGAKICQITKSPVLIIALVMIFGILLGGIKGVMVVNMKIPPIIATMGMSSIYTGITYLVCNNQSINNVVPAGMVAFVKTKIFNINICIWALLLLMVILAYVYECTPFGKRMYAVGYSPKVARLAGINDKLTRLASFVISGAIIGVCGLIMLCRQGGGYPNGQTDYLLPGNALVFFSVTAFTPGRFNVPGLLISFLLLAVVFNGISLLGAPFWMEALLNGLIMLVVVLTTKIKEAI